ncbi:MAG: tRNA uridine-5-carboxymethylaminomethyl(34) synthesis GTPase MnmE [Fibrobacter sp.]|nr:tRNA uridine-5-carboxymethylaminomethyl(34) synthesis GTPase MnmE [Fibrobacter sp.]
MDLSRTIAAVATPTGTGALAIIRISGKMAFENISHCLFSPEKFLKAETGKIFLHKFKKSGTEQVIDEVTVIKYREPYSYTGENMVEIFCHGGPYIVRSIIRELNASGIDGAQKGEFTRRAFLNGKMDLTKAEAVKSVIECKNEIENRIAISALDGEQRRRLENWKEEIIKVLIQIETEIEFEEDHDVITEKTGKTKILDLIAIIKDDLKKRGKIKEIEGGFRIVIAGPANAGKSTLFNQMIGYQRALTHKEPGTTRDWISEKWYLEGNEIILIDTAGIRETDNEVERAGIDRSLQEIGRANITIWVTSADEELSTEEIKSIKDLSDKNSIFLINKTDLNKNENKENLFNTEGIPVYKTSLTRDKDIQNITEEINSRINRIKNTIEFPDIISSVRQESIARDILDVLIESIENWGRAEIAAHYLNKSLEYIEEIIGKKDNEEVLNRIFEGFCIGK